MKKINDIVFIAALLVLIIVQLLLRKFILSPAISEYNSAFINFIFNFLLGICLLGFYVKKYTPDKFRIILMIVFLLELVTGIFMRKIKIHYGAEIMFIGLLGVLATWYYTHQNRQRFDH